MFVDQLDLASQLARVAHDASDDGLVRAGEERVVTQALPHRFAHGGLIRAMLDPWPTHVDQPRARKAQCAVRRQQHEQAHGAGATPPNKIRQPNQDASSMPERRPNATTGISRQSAAPTARPRRGSLLRVKDELRAAKQGERAVAALGTHRGIPNLGRSPQMDGGRGTLHDALTRGAQVVRFQLDSGEA